MLKPKTLFTTLLFFVMIYNSKAYAAPKKLILITINTATIEDFLNNDILRDIAENGVVGLMNTRSNGINNQYKPYMTLGAGQKGEVTFDCIESYKADLDLIEKYNEITLQSCQRGNLVNLYINKLCEINSQTLYNAKPGKLGSVLKNNAITTALIGGFYYDNNIKSPAFFINMTEQGSIDYGEIHGTFQNGKMDMMSVIKIYNMYKDISDFIVIEFGEIESLYANKKIYSELSYNINKQKLIMEFGKAIKIIKDNTDFHNTVLCIMAPYSSDISKKDTMILSPIIIYDGGKNRGIAVSKTTRRPGIISALDFAPFVLEYFNIKYDEFIGYPIKNIFVENNLNYILALNKNVLSSSLARVPMLKGFAIFIIIILIICMIMVLRGKNLQSSILLFFIKFCMIIPLLLLLEGAFRIGSIFIKTIFIISGSIVLTFLLDRYNKNEIKRLAVIVFINMLLLLIDILFKQNMLKYSVFSYDPIIGARFYGLGNEYLGVLIGCTLVLCGCLLEKSFRLKPLVYTLLFFIMFIIGLPSMGSNAGGFITATFSFLVFILLEIGWNLKKALKYGILLCLLFLILYSIISIMLKTNQSHIGKMFEQVGLNGSDYFINMFYRKFNMAVKLIKYTIWSRVLIFLIGTVMIIFIKPYGYFKYLFLNRRHICNAWLAALLASLTAILTNDSGIVTAAVIMIYTVFSMIIFYSKA